MYTAAKLARRVFASEYLSFCSKFERLLTSKQLLESHFGIRLPPKPGFSTIRNYSAHSKPFPTTHFWRPIGFCVRFQTNSSDSTGFGTIEFEL